MSGGTRALKLGGFIEFPCAIPVVFWGSDMARAQKQSQVRAELAALKRDRIVTAASVLFAQYGFENTRLDVVAEQLGVTKQFIYSEFSSKAELLAEICLRAVSSTLIITEGVHDGGGPAADRLFEFVRLFTIGVCSHHTDVTVFAHERKNLTEPDRIRLDGVRREVDQRIHHMLLDGVKSGEFTISSPRLTALMIQGMISWMYVWYREDGGLPLEDLATEAANHVMAMVAVKTPEKKRKPRTSGGGARQRTTSAASSS